MNTQGGGGGGGFFGGTAYKDFSAGGGGGGGSGFTADGTGMTTGVRADNDRNGFVALNLEVEPGCAPTPPTPGPVKVPLVPPGRLGHPSP
jgi:hypothetical protein